MIADDDDALRLALVTMIQVEGFSVVEADNGAEALELFAREKPDIVLLDTVMPRLNGYEVCQALRLQVPDVYELPILMITMMDDLESIQKAQSAGASDYLIKPIQWSLLTYRLHVMFKQKKMLAERKKIEDKLLHTHKLSAIRQLTGGFAHDFNNILASQLGYTELALNCCDEHADEKLIKYLGEVQKASLRGKILIEYLMMFAMNGMDMTSISEAQNDFSDSIKAMVKDIPSHIKFESICNVENEWIGVDFIQFHQILMNLIENAIDAIENSGAITVKLEKRCQDRSVCTSCLSEFEGEYLILSVTDDGGGIDDKIAQRIFEPFYTTKPVGRGTGHGMSVIHGIVHAAGGHIHVASEVGKGCTIEVFFLLMSSAQQAAV